MSAGAPARTRPLSLTSAAGAGAARSGSPSASSRRRSGSRSSYSRKTSRTRERSGSRAASAAMSRSTRKVALDGREALGDARVLGVLEQVLFALGAFDLVDVREHVLQRAVALDQLARRLVADAGDAGDVVGGVALQPVEVGDQLRRDSVAVDHRLAVVDLRVGDPARGRHHLDDALTVDQLEDVAVAGDDHHRHGRVGPKRALGERGDHVVGLEALDAHVA